MSNLNENIPSNCGYAKVNGLSMYYEIYGEGKPLVLVHGGGSTIQTSFGRAIPLLATSRKVIAVELQAHGRTSDRGTDLSFEQDADDIAAVLDHLNIERADIFGFSNGATTAVQFAIRHPHKIRKLIAGSVLCKRNGIFPEFCGFMEQASLDNMPQALKDAYLEVASHPENLQVMHDRDVKRMINFQDIAVELIKSIAAPTLFITGDRDVITPEHNVELFRLIAGSRLAILPGVHGEYIGEITTLKPGYEQSHFAIPLITAFLDEE